MCSGFSSTVVALWRASAIVAASVLTAACVADAQPAVNASPPLPDVTVGPWPGPMESDEDPHNPFAADKVALMEGRKFYLSYNCAGCHGDHGGGGMGPSLRDEEWIYGSTHGQIARSIADGRAYGMPAWRVMLTPAQIWQITAYLKSLRTPHEPQKPE